MITTYSNIFKRLFFSGLLLILIAPGCERAVSDLEDAGLSQEPNIFTDTPVGMGSDFYFPFQGSRPDVFSVDDDVAFESSASIRIDVPNADDPAGNFAGAIFRIDGPGRDLTGYNALTFYAKASQGANIGEIGFGLDFIANKYQVTRSNLSVGTSWTKYIVPIPDPSKLTEERGMLWLSAGTQQTGGFGYTFWIDELKFENLDNSILAQPRASILGSTEADLTSFTGSTLSLSELSYTINYSPSANISARDITVSIAPSYFSFSSSNPAAATVNELGVVTVQNSGTATITASLNGQQVDGSLAVESLGELPASPTPSEDPQDVKSIFSDAYTSETTSNFSPGFGGSTAQESVLSTSNGEVISYSNNNYTGIVFDNTVDASALTTLRIDAYVLDASTSIGIQIRDIGDNGVIDTNVFNGNPTEDDADYRETLTGFQVGVWKTFEIPLAGNIANQKDNLGALIITGGPDFILDNIYFY